ncbi:MAG TPA: hypothetical protein VJU78_11030, partial [Chitinophagaceae bacterium]|nr:hypothetical protein [Chitinophagaceae bacterium]
GWFAEIPAPKLVDSILDKGTIKVYLNMGSDSTNSQIVVPLPILDILLTGAIINPYFTTQLITLVSTDDVSSVEDNGNHYFQYRYVLIPGGSAARPGPNGKTVDWNNYKEVQQYLGLKD